MKKFENKKVQGELFTYKFVFFSAFNLFCDTSKLNNSLSTFILKIDYCKQNY